MNKILIVLTFFCSASCSSLMNGQLQPVKLIDNRNNTYLTTCNGTAETMGSCHNKARDTCNKGYKVLNEKIDSTGIFREVIFQCK